MKISEKFEDTDWINDTAQLQSNANLNDWAMLYDKYFIDRLETRYFGPMRAIEQDKVNCSFWGKGFSIATIQCSLIEFLQATYEGKTYNRQATQSDEYPSSGQMFTRFLASQAPFSNTFTQAIAQTFYKSVRNGLIHEARTKGNWLIHMGQEQGPLYENDGQHNIVYWKSFYFNLDDYVATRYRAELLLPQNTVLRDNFKSRLQKLFTT